MKRLQQAYSVAQSIREQFPDLSMDFLTRYALDNHLTDRETLTRLDAATIHAINRKLIILTGERGPVEVRASDVWGSNLGEYKQVAIYLRQLGLTMRKYGATTYYRLDIITPYDLEIRGWTLMDDGSYTKGDFRVIFKDGNTIVDHHPTGILVDNATQKVSVAHLAMLGA